MPKFIDRATFKDQNHDFKNLDRVIVRVRENCVTLTNFDYQDSATVVLTMSEAKRLSEFLSEATKTGEK